MKRRKRSRHWYTITVDLLDLPRVYVMDNGRHDPELRMGAIHMNKAETIKRAKITARANITTGAIVAVREVLPGKKSAVGRIVWPNPSAIESIASLA